MKKSVKFMKFLWLVALVTTTLLLLPNPIHALPSVGSSPATNNPALDTDNPQSWVGKKFILLEKEKGLQWANYQMFRIHQDGYVMPQENRIPTLEDQYGALLYDKFKGDTLTVTSVAATDTSMPGLAPQEYTVTFKDDNNNISIYSDTELGKIDGIAPVEELAQARKAWVGKTVWSKSRYLNRYSATTGDLSGITVSLGEPLKVTDASWGDNSNAPIWIIVRRNNGQTGYYEIAVSSMAVGLVTDGADADWSDSFFDSNPRSLYPWSLAIWNKVRNGIISIGMTYDQVEVALGTPSHINKDVYANAAAQQWVYEHRYVYFSNGKVRVIQER